MATVAELAASLGKSNKVVLDKLAEMGVFAPGPGYELTGTERSKVREALDVVIDPKKRKKDDGTPAHSRSTGPGAGEGGKQPTDGGDDGDAEDESAVGNGSGEESEGDGDGEAEAEGQSESEEEEEGDGEGEDSGEGEEPGDESEGEGNASDEFEEAEADSEAEQEQESEQEQEPPYIELGEHATYYDLARELNTTYEKLQLLTTLELDPDATAYNTGTADIMLNLAAKLGYEIRLPDEAWSDDGPRPTIGRVLTNGKVQLSGLHPIRVGDAIVAGKCYCRVQTIHDDDGLAYNVVGWGEYTITGWNEDLDDSYRRGHSVILVPNDKVARRYARS